MNRFLTLATLLLSLVLLTPIAHAATLAPVKPYVKPGEPLDISFLQPAEGKSDDAKKALDAVGLEAVKIPGLFTAAPAADIIDAGPPQFTLYSFDGKKIDPNIEYKKLPGKSPLNLLDFYPQLKDAGTYILAWKDATPLVINVLRNPLPWGMIMQMPREQQPLLRAQLLVQQKTAPVVATHIVPLEMAVIATDKGDIKATFAYDVAPNTVANFILLSQQKFYDGSAFHRTIKGFMIQGGDSVAKTDRAGTAGPGHQVAAEISDKKHERGTLSMARSEDVNSAGSQFFIMHAKADFLDGAYTAFGQTIEGLDVVDKIVETPVIDKNGSTKPEDRVAIKSITILPATLDQYGLKK